MKLNEYFDKIVCINLKERPDKKEKIQKRFNELDIKVEWFHPVQFGFTKKIVPILHNSGICNFNITQPNEFGCALSHYSVIKSALLEGVEKLFVFEDDLLFHKDFNLLIDKSLNKIPENWDMLMLYSYMINIQQHNVKVNSMWMKAYDSWSLTSYGVNRKFMEEYIRRQDEKLQVADIVSYEMQRSYNCYVTHPTLCIPDTEIGSNIRKHMNYKSTPSALNAFTNTNDYN